MIKLREVTTAFVHSIDIQTRVVSMISIRFMRWCVMAACSLVPSFAAAFTFAVSEAEFLTWPMYCQARYSSLDVGRQYNFSMSFSRALMDEARTQLGAATFERVHHWCAGTVWLNRARVEPDPAVREFQLSSAKNESLFTLTGLPSDSPIISSILVTLGLTCQEQKDFTCATEQFEKAIATSLTDPAPYSALAILYRKLNRLDLAREVLLRGDKAVDGKSPEIHYNLGLILLEMKDVDGALAYAKKAYAGSLQLPGLKNKLIRMGRWVEPKLESPAEPQSAAQSP